MTKRGFVLGKFLPPHAGHEWLCRTAAAMVDQLTILVCSLPDDPIPGPLRARWMAELFPTARIVHHDAVVPQHPNDSPDFWPIWRGIVAAAHPEPIDYVFAGEDYGLRLAREVGGFFVPLGERMADDPGLAGLSGTQVRADPWGQWHWLPAPVRAHYTRTICLHGVESTGKSVLATRLAAHFGTIWVSEYGRFHCEAHGTDLDADGLLLIGAAQSAMIEAAKPWCDKRLFVDTDAVMTAAWAEMMLGETSPPLLEHPKADLYLLLEPDVAWIDDGTRIYGEDDSRSRFAAITRAMLDRAGVAYVSIAGDWEDRFAKAVAAVDALDPPS